jgi:hypothetical protein
VDDAVGEIEDAAGEVEMDAGEVEVNVGGDVSSRDVTNTYMETFIEWYHQEFFGTSLDEFIERHRSIMSRLGLLRLPPTVRHQYRDMYRKFSPKLVKKHAFPNLLAYFKFLHDELVAAYADEQLQLIARQRPVVHRAAFDLFPAIKPGVAHVHIDGIILQWIAGQLHIDPVPEPIDCWNRIFKLKKVRLRNVPSSISLKTDGCAGSVSFDKKDLMYVTVHGTD